MTIEPKLLASMIDLLRAFPSNGKLPNGDAALGCITAGLVEKREVTKPCRECGTPRPDYSYFRISAAGRVLLAAVGNTENRHAG